MEGENSSRRPRLSSLERGHNMDGSLLRARLNLRRPRDFSRVKFYALYTSPWATMRAINICALEIIIIVHVRVRCIVEIPK